jgi:hypothetical protein
VHVGVPGIAGNKSGSAIHKPERTWKRRGQVWECQHHAWPHKGASATSLRAPQMAAQQAGKNDFFFLNAAGSPGNYSCYIMFNNFSNSGIPFVLSSMYLYSYPSTHGIS